MRPHPTFGLVMIVRNEAEAIDRVLDSAAAYISSATIMDTGSTDGTLEKIAAHGWTARHLKWENFGQARSAAFAAARGTADWLLALDADFTVEIDPNFIPDPIVDAYMLEMGSDAFSYRLPLLLSGHSAWKSVGAVHEYTIRADDTLGRREPTDQVRITNHGTDRQNDPARTRRYAKLLREEMARNPDDPRTIFYLAQSERELGHPAKARRLYEQRATMGGYEEERWYAAYRAALLEPWSAERLMGAWEQRPHRLEPLYYLLRGLNERNMHQAAYRLAIPSPASTDGLFVEAWIWDWGIVFERSIACWWAAPRAEFEELTAQLLANPRVPMHIREQVERNAGLIQPAAPSSAAA